MMKTLESQICFESKPVRYIPPLCFKSLTPIFDAFLKVSSKESAFKPKLVEQARIQKDFRVLDLGCGTATLTILAKKMHPSAEVIGIDIDPSVLEIAKKKAGKANVQIKFDLGPAFMLPYPDDYFDRVLSSLVFHHLTRENKIRTLKEVQRVLKPNGELHIADLGKPQNIVMELPSAIMRRLEESEDNVRGLLPCMLKIAGFRRVEEADKIMTVFGTVALYKGQKPSSTSSAKSETWDNAR